MVVVATVLVEVLSCHSTNLLIQLRNTLDNINQDSRQIGSNLRVFLLPIPIAGRNRQKHGGRDKDLWVTKISRYSVVIRKRVMSF